MSQFAVRTSLRLIAVTMMLVGICLASFALVGMLGMQSAVEGIGMQVQMTGVVSNMGFYVVLAYATIVAWGIILYAMSSGLSAKIIS